MDGLKKNKSRQSDKQRELEKLFLISLERLFDISYNDSLHKMKNEDKERLGVSGSTIPVAHKLIERKEYWQKLVQMQPSDDKLSTLPEIQPDETHLNDGMDDTISAINESNNEVNLSTKSVSETEYFGYATDMSLAAAEFDVETDSDEEYLPPNKYRKKTTKKKKAIMTPELSEALDRTKTSNRAAVYILAFAAIGMGLNPENMVINRESFRQSRLINSRESAIQMQENFNPNTALTLHWDGKLLPNSNLNQKVDRIVVVVTGHEILQILRVPYLELVLQTVQKWNHVQNKIEFVCFDTTNVNSGRIKGICVLLQKLMGNLLERLLVDQLKLRHIL